MIELVILACLAASPTDCSFHVIGRGMGPWSCAAAIQPTAAKWAGDHPNHVVRKAICRPEGVDA